MYEVQYLTPQGNKKWVLWRGKHEMNAERSWLEMAAPGTVVYDVKPKTLTWYQ
jgi:hypothetical protein